MSAYKFTQWAVASPDAPQKPLVWKRARSGDAAWVQVVRHRPGSQAKKALYRRKVRLTKQRNVDLTPDGLWAMPLNTAWVPVKARRLQDLKIEDWKKKYVPVHKEGDVFPMGSQPLWRGTTMTAIRIQNNQCTAPSCALPKFQLCAQKCDPSAPSNPHISETAFSHRFQQQFTPPPNGTKVWCIGREENCSAGGWVTRRPIFPTPRPPSLAAVTGGGVQGGGARPAGPGGGGVNTTSMAQNDTHVALIILTTQMWGGGEIIGGKGFFRPKFVFLRLRR